MREPPRLHDGVRSENIFSDSAAGNAGAGSSFLYSQPPVKPPSGAWKTVVLAFVGTFLVMGLLCGGSVTWLYFVFNAPTEMTAELVDYPRAVEEMQASGISVGVNALTTSRGIDNLKLSFSVPTLDAYHQIVDFRWLITNKEARVTVVGFSEWGDAANVYLFPSIRCTLDSSRA